MRENHAYSWRFGCEANMKNGEYNRRPCIFKIKNYLR